MRKKQKPKKVVKKTVGNPDSFSLSWTYPEWFARLLAAIVRIVGFIYTILRVAEFIIDLKNRLFYEQGPHGEITHAAFFLRYHAKKLRIIRSKQQTTSMQLIVIGR